MKIRVTLEETHRERHLWPYIVLSGVATFIAGICLFITSNFGLATADEIIFQIQVPEKGTNPSFIGSAIAYILGPFAVVVAGTIVCAALLKQRAVHLSLGSPPETGKAASAKAEPVKAEKRTMRKARGGKGAIRVRLTVRTLCLALTTIMTVYTAVFTIRVDLIPYIVTMTRPSAFIEQHYVDPAKVSLQFPEKKRNLIYIFMESMESDFMSMDEGGLMDKSRIPKLADIAADNTSFVRTGNQPNLQQLSNTGWTIAAMVSQQMGLPLKLPPSESNDYGEAEYFLPHVTGLGDILESQGYRQALMVGSDAAFGGRKDMYTQHGSYEIYDLFTARNEGLVPPDYSVWWGFEDKHLFTYAEEKLTELASSDQPFAFVTLTADTHHPDGFRSNFCPNDFPDPYSNALECSDIQVAAFLQWIMQQDFYENTTVVLAGDHLTMDTDFVEMYQLDTPDRYIYNAYVNAVEPDYVDTTRDFSVFDMFPTTLAALGVTIKGNRLGLGTNLFSSTPTLIESVGYDAVEQGMSAYSPFYKTLFFP